MSRVFLTSHLTHNKTRVILEPVKPVVLTRQDETGLGCLDFRRRRWAKTKVITELDLTQDM